MIAEFDFVIAVLIVYVLPENMPRVNKKLNVAREMEDETAGSSSGPPEAKRSGALTGAEKAARYRASRSEQKKKEDLKK